MWTLQPTPHPIPGVDRSLTSFDSHLSHWDTQHLPGGSGPRHVPRHVPRPRSRLRLPRPRLQHYALPPHQGPSLGPCAWPVSARPAPGTCVPPPHTAGSPRLWLQEPESSSSRSAPSFFLALNPHGHLGLLCSPQRGRDQPYASPPIRPRSHCRVAARSRMRPRARKDRGLSTCFVGRGCLASMQGRGTEPLWGFRRHACPRPQQGWSGHSRAKAATCPTPPEACRTAQPGRGLSPGPGSQANESELSPAGSPRTRVAVRGWTWLQGAAGEQAGDPAPLSPGWTCHRVPLTLLRPQPAAMSRHTAETSG